MDAIKNNPKTTAIGGTAAIIGLVQAAALAFGFDIKPEHLTLMSAALPFMIAVIGFMGKDGDKA